MPETYTLESLITAVDRDRRLAVEVLRKLPQLVTATGGDIVFELDENVNFPSLAKLREELQLGGLDELGNRIIVNENLTQGIVQELARIAKKQGDTIISPYWRTLDLTAENVDGRTNDPLWRAQVGDNFFRFPYEAFDEKPLDRKFDTQGTKLGGKLLPPYTENVTLEKRYSSAPAVANVVNTNAYPAFTRNVTYSRLAYYYYYYGYYYTWGYYAYGAYGAYTVTYSATVTESLTGSVTAQTFQLSADRVITGVDVEILNPGGTKTAANPKMYICENEQGMPMFSKIIGYGTLRDNSNASNTSTTATTSVQFDLSKPLLLNPGKSYSIIFTSNNTWNIGYSSNADNTGGVFYSQDGQYWSSDLQKDLCYILRVADFGSGVTSFTIELNALSLAGGIGSLNYKKSIDAPSGGDISIEIDINNNGNWSPLATVANIQSLPTYCPIRAVFTGSRYAMALLDTQNSKIVAFRPATSLRYISKDRTLQTTGKLDVAYSLYGYDNTDPSEPMHSFLPRLKMVDGPQITINPDMITTNRSEDGKVTKVTASFTIPVGATTYRHDIIGTTRSANTLFDGSSILEMTS